MKNLIRKSAAEQANPEARTSGIEAKLIELTEKGRER